MKPSEDTKAARFAEAALAATLAGCCAPDTALPSLQMAWPAVRALAEGGADEALLLAADKAVLRGDLGAVEWKPIDRAAYASTTYLPPDEALRVREQLAAFWAARRYLEGR